MAARSQEASRELAAQTPSPPPAGGAQKRLAVVGIVLLGTLIVGLLDDWFVWDHVPVDVNEQAQLAALETADAELSKRHPAAVRGSRGVQQPAVVAAAPPREQGGQPEEEAEKPAAHQAPEPDGPQAGAPAEAERASGEATPASAGEQPPAADEGSGAASSASAATFGFYFPVYDQIPGVLGVVSSVRKHYPDSPIHLVQDGGSVDFGRVCKMPKYGCTFEVVVGENSRWNPHSWFKRMRSAALRLKTTYMIYLEPDVLVRRRHAIEPAHDAGGIFDNYNPGPHEETVAYMERRGRERVPCFKVEWDHFGLAGGSYYRTEAVIDAFDPVHVERIDWGPMQWREGDKTMSSDFAMIVALACRGWTVYPWKESAQNFAKRGLPDDEAGRAEFGRQWPAYNPKAAFEHDHKEHYSDPVPEEEMRLIDHQEETLLTCHGCVWYEGAGGERLASIQPPRPSRVEDWYAAMLLTPALAPASCTDAEKAASAALRPGQVVGPTPNPALTAAALVMKELMDSGKVVAQNQECASQAQNFGRLDTVERCLQKVVATPECGNSFMFSHIHPDWGCRCCSPGSANGPASFQWDVFGTGKEPATDPQPAPAPAEPVAEQPAAKQAEAAAEAPVAVASGPYREAIALKGRECSEQGTSHGHVSIEECDRLTAAHPDCGYSFMYSPSHPDWQCRCCTFQGRDDGPASEHWNVYDVRTAHLPRPPTTTTTPDPLAGARGLPLLQDGPEWLVKNDGLVVDSRPSEKGGMVILQAVLMDVSGDWGKKQTARPRWLRSILATNRDHSRRFKHAMVVRWQKTQPQLTKWQLRDCSNKGRSLQWCEREWERENINWEKHLMMSEYLLSPQGFSHVLMMDADAAVVRPDMDVLQHMADLLDSEGKDLLLSDEDWLNNGKGRINGGLMFAKNTPFTRNLFQDTFDCHVQLNLAPWRIGVQSQHCGSNEQIALNDLLRGGGKSIFAPHALLTSGMKYNRGGCVIHACGDGGMSDQRMHEKGMLDQDMYIMHFMGAMKGGAPAVLCGEGGSARAGDKDLTGDGPQGYGCQP